MLPASRRRLFGLCLCLHVAVAADFSAAQEPEVGGEPSAEAAPSAESGAEEPQLQLPPSEPPPPIYEEQLLRLAEILGSLSFLRGLCGATDAETWRDEMRALLAAEHPGPLRQGRLVGRFNHGFETFNAVYRSCTPSAERAIRRYLEEGQTLANDVRSRYSQ
jgi:uncharacterized protein (TIGR02301 family)